MLSLHEKPSVIGLGEMRIAEDGPWVGRLSDRVGFVNGSEVMSLPPPRSLFIHVDFFYLRFCCMFAQWLISDISHLHTAFLLN